MRILVAINGSSDDRDLLGFASQVAQRAIEPLTILAVVESGAGCLPRLTEELSARVRAQWQPSHVLVRTRVRVGHPAKEIVREIQSGTYGLLVLDGNCHSNLVSRWRSTLTPASVTRRAPCSVAIVKGRVGTIRRILLCDSGAHGPVAAPPWENAGHDPSVSERFAARLLALFGAGREVTILHVMSQISAGPGVRGKQLRADAVQLIGEHTIEGELLARDVRLLESSGVHSRARVRHGFVVDEILAEARGGDYDLVVIGAPAGEGWRRFLLDDLAAQIVEKLDRPVLVVR